MKSQFQSKEELEGLLKAYSAMEIAKQRGINRITIYRAMERLGVDSSCYIHAYPHGRGPRGARHWNWKGGRILDGEGYVRLYQTRNPSTYNTTYILEHRFVMEQKLGRSLSPDEGVHHINGVRVDNRIENLELIIRRGAHYGQIQCPYCSGEFTLR